MALLTDRKFIHFNKKSDFEALLNANAISDKQIVFLKDAQEIWTHGTYYGSVEQFLDETNKDSTNAISAAAVYKALTDDEKTIAAALNDLNDKYTNLDSSKQDIISDLDTIRENAQLGASKVSNVQSDWNATTGDAVILNKPNIENVDIANVFGTKINGLGGEFISLTGGITISNSNYNSANIKLGYHGGSDDDTITLTSRGSDGGVHVISDQPFTYNNKEIATVDQLITPPVTSVNGQTGDVEINIPSKVSDLTDDLSLATLDYVNDRLDDVLGISAEGVEAFVNMTRDEDTATGILTEIANKALKTNAVNGAPLSNTESYFYGTSTTAAATALKEVSIPSITSLKTGQIIVVKPTITSTVANSTIKLNNFTAYPMRYNNAAITISTNSVVWNASFPSIWVFDGNYWVFLGHGFDNNTTYYAMSQGEATTGTATTARIISAKVLNDTIEGHTKLSSSYQPSSLENDDLILDGGDTYETAFGKLEKSINDNEEITAAALTDLDERIPVIDQELSETSENPVQNKVITQAIIDNEYVVSTALNNINDRLENKQDTLISGTNIKTINNLSLLGTGNINISNIEIIEVNANIRADVTKDGTITVDDTTALAKNLNTTNLQYDLNNDGLVTIADVTLSTNIALNKPHNLYIDIETNPYSLITTSFNNSKIPILRLVFPGNLIKDILIQKTNNTPVYYGEDIYAIQIPSSGNGINLSETILKIFVQISETEANGIIGHIVTKEGLATKQDILVSGTNIKTINNQSLLGSGNITIQGGSGGDTNVIETVKVNGTALTPDANKAVDITVPTTLDSISDGTTRKLSNYLPLSGGTMTGAITVAPGDGKGLLFSNTSNINVSGTTNTILGFYNGTYIIGHTAYPVNIRGTNTRPNYNGNQLALYSDIPSAVTESTVAGWGFTKNAGTITGITMNGSSKGTSGVVDLGTVLTKTVVTVTQTGENTFTANKTHAEILSLITSGQEVVLELIYGANDAIHDIYTYHNRLNGGNEGIIFVNPLALSSLIIYNNETIVSQEILSDAIISDLGFTKNAGTITGITMNGSSKGISGVVDLGTVITEHQDISGKANTADLATVATSGSYNDLSNKPTIPAAQVQSDWNATSGMGVILNKPTIPTVNNATLTIQKNGTTVNTFTANASSNVTANIQVNELPTVSSSDNGKVLQVVNGVWSLVMPTAIYTGSSTPSNSLGNDGDIYVQS